MKKTFSKLYFILTKHKVFASIIIIIGLAASITGNVYTKTDGTLEIIITPQK